MGEVSEEGGVQVDVMSFLHRAAYVKCIHSCIIW